MIKDFIKQVLIPYFQQWNTKFFINILRYAVGCFFECFPISSSMVNSLFYSSKQEKQIEKNNINLHVITGIAGLFFFIFLRWNLPYDNNIYFNSGNFSIIIIYGMVWFVAIGYYYFFQMVTIFPPMEWIIGILGFLKFKCYIPHNILTLVDFFTFISSTFNLYIIFNSFNIFFHYSYNWFHSHNKFIVFIKYLLIFTTFFSIGHTFFSPKQMFVYTIILSKLALIQLVVSPQGILYNIKYLNLMGIATFTNSYFNGEIYSIWDVAAIIVIFFYGIVDKFFKDYGFFDYKNFINDNLLKFFLLMILTGLSSFFIMKYEIIGVSMYWLAPLGLLIGMPLSKKIKKYIYQNANHKVYNYQSIITNLFMTFIFIGIYCMKFVYEKGYYCSPPLAYFIVGFTNSWAMMPGFSRMLLTFLVGFILKIDINEIILLNYFLLFITSIGQWIIFQWEGPINVINIYNHLMKKTNQFLLLFNYKKEPQRSLRVAILLIVWSFFLMYKFLPSLYTSKFWWQSIGFRLFIAALFLLLLKYKNLDTKIS